MLMAPIPVPALQPNSPISRWFFLHSCYVRFICSLLSPLTGHTRSMTKQQRAAAEALSKTARLAADGEVRSVFQPTPEQMPVCMAAGQRRSNIANSEWPLHTPCINLRHACPQVPVPTFGVVACQFRSYHIAALFTRARTPSLHG